MNDFPQNKISVRGPLDPYMERVDPCFINALSLVTLCDQVFVTMLTTLCLEHQ